MMMQPGSSRRRTFLLLQCTVAAWLMAATAGWGASYLELRSAAIATCQGIDPSAYQSGLIFNPDGYRSYYVRSECFQRIAVQFRDATLCAEVKQRRSLFSSSWGYSQAQCSERVRAAIAADEKIVAVIKQRYRQGAVRLHDFRVERNGNGRDFDIIPSFAGDDARGYLLRFEILPISADKPAILIHSSAYYVDGGSHLRIFLRQQQVRERFADFVLGGLYTVRATLILDIGDGGPAGKWSDDFIQRTFPERQRSQSMDRQIRF